MTPNVSVPQERETRDLAVSVIDDLFERGLALTPANYEVWLAYRLNSKPELTAQIDALVAKDEALTQAQLDTLFGDFFSSSPFSERVAATGDTIARELADMLDHLHSNGEHNRTYGETLLAASQIETAELDGSGFTTLVKDLFAATRKMAAHNQELAAQMQQSAEHVESLKTTLQNVRAEASTDGLTGLANRRTFDSVLATALADNGGRPLCLMLCDIDHFKRVNDRFGHQMGDQVLRYVAGVLSRMTPTGALAARYGGEEFAVILPSNNADEAAKLAEAILADLRSRRITKRSTGETIGAITVSIGLAQWQGEPATDLIARADQCLYAAKRAGRDRLVSDERAARAA